MRGAPEVRRLKTYQSETGYVYQYYYDGWRPVEGGREFVFMATANRGEYGAVAVVIEEAAVRAWEAARGRELISAEQHAVAKMALFAAFDDRRPEEIASVAVRVDEAGVEKFLEQLGRG
ncbi:MAG TPA: hypothetical protein VFB63_00760 [Bryobacteraceae bacterium]|nr:hypothetical protein [Bryobacteraceae bacterium]